MAKVQVAVRRGCARRASRKLLPSRESIALAAFLSAGGCGGSPIMGLAAPEDGGERDTTARDADVQDASHTMSDAFRDRWFDVGSDGEERDAFSRDTSGAVDSTNEPDHARDAPADAARGIEGGDDAPSHGGPDSRVVPDVMDTRDAGAHTSGDANDATDPRDASPTDAQIDLPTDIEIDLTVADIGAVDVADASIDIDPD